MTPAAASVRPRPGRAGPALAVALVARLLSEPAHATASSSAPAPIAPSTARPGTAPKAAATPHRAPAAATRAPAPPSRKTVLQRAAEARSLEDLGAYGQAASALRELRGRVAPDADLEIALALDEARTGQLDSAATRLWGPLLSRALADTMPLARRHTYGWQREGVWTNGRFDGWHWYVARARAEVAARRGRWAEARDAASEAVAALALSGQEWLILALCAGHAGDLDVAERSARRAAWLDPTLPEAQYLAGLFDWRAGRRAAARESFRAAVALDSSYREPALALVRSLLPGAAPDSLPGRLLTGVRAVALLTSPARPKLDEFVQMDTPATILQQDLPALPDSLKGRFKPVQMYLPIMVDERGRAVLQELPYSTPEQFPEALERLTLLSMSGWRYTPATRHGVPQRVWANVQILYNP